MSEIDAVKVLECMAIDMVGALAGLSKKEPLADVLCQRIEAINLAQSALREKAERENGCEYCNDREDLAFGHDSLKRVGSIYIDKNLLVADLYSESMAVAICFCPVCGKRLEVEP